MMANPIGARTHMSGLEPRPAAPPAAPPHAPLPRGDLHNFHNFMAQNPGAMRRLTAERLAPAPGRPAPAAPARPWHAAVSEPIGWAVDNTLGRASRMAQAPAVGAGATLATVGGALAGGGRDIGRANPTWWDNFRDALVGEGTRTTGAAWDQLASFGGHQVDSEFARAAAGLREGGSPGAARALEVGQGGYNLGAQMATGGLIGRGLGALRGAPAPAAAPAAAAPRFPYGDPRAPFTMGGRAMPPTVTAGATPGANMAAGYQAMGSQAAAGQAARAGMLGRAGGAASGAWQRLPRWAQGSLAGAGGTAAMYIGLPAAIQAGVDKTQQLTGTGAYSPANSYDASLQEVSRPSFQQQLAGAKTPEAQDALLRPHAQQMASHLAAARGVKPEQVLAQMGGADNRITQDELVGSLNPQGGGQGGAGGQAQGWANPWTMIGAPLGLYGLMQLLGGRGGMESLLPLLLGTGMAAHGTGLIDLSNLGSLFGGGQGGGAAQVASGSTGGNGTEAMPDAKREALLERAYGGDTAAQDELAVAHYPNVPAGAMRFYNDARRMFNPNAVRDEIATKVEERARAYADRARAARG